MPLDDCLADQMKPTRSCRKTQINITLFTMGCVLAALVAVPLSMESDDLTDSQPMKYIDCLQSSIDSVEKNGMIDFIVVMEHPYKKNGTFVGKLPVNVLLYHVYAEVQVKEDENLVLVENRLIWHGRHNITKNKLPSGLFYFQNGKGLEEAYRHYYMLRCPSLNIQLDDIHQKHSQMDFPRRSDLLFCEHDDKIACDDFKVFYTIGIETTVDVAIVFKHWYEKEGVRVNVYPMKENEKIVMTEHNVHWYRSFEMIYRDRFEETIVSFEKTRYRGIIARTFYKLSCPGLNNKLEEISAEWRNYRDTWAMKGLILCSLGFVTAGCIMGLLLGNCLVRKPFSDKVKNST